MPIRDPRSYTYISLVPQTDTVTACTSLSRASLGIEGKGGKKGRTLLLRPISYLVACPLPCRCFIYYVDQVRDGRSSSTHSVRAVQSGRTVFVVLCSLQIPELGQPSDHWTMSRAPLLRMKARAKLNIPGAWRQPDLHRRAQIATHRVDKGVLSYRAILRPRDAERRTFMYWMKAKAVTTQQHCAAFQKVRILFAIGPSLVRHQCILG